MELSLSKRLLACCSFVSPGDRVADIGCDHGYLGIHLLTNQIASSVIASDINQGPLHSARQNAEKFGVKERICFYLSDGLRNIPQDFDCMICAGMGADTMISILSAAPWLKNDRYRLVLQCQSKTHLLRKYLTGNGWEISREIPVRDGRFIYTVMDVRRQPGTAQLSPGQTYFSPALLATPGQDAAELYLRLLYSLQRANRGRGAHADPDMVAAQQELEQLARNPQNTWLKEASPWQP